MWVPLHFIIITAYCKSHGRVYLRLWTSDAIFQILKSWKQTSKIHSFDTLNNRFFSLNFVITIAYYTVCQMVNFNKSYEQMMLPLSSIKNLKKSTIY